MLQDKTLYNSQIKVKKKRALSVRKMAEGRNADGSFIPTNHLITREKEVRFCATCKTKILFQNGIKTFGASGPSI